MNRMSPKTRRYLTLAVTAFVSVGAAALIIMNRVGVEAGQAAQNASSTQVSSEEEVSVPPIIVASQESKSGSASAFVPSSGASAAAPLTTISKPTSAPPNPTLPASSVLKDKNKKPNYSSKPVASKKTTATPKNGEVRNGKTYVDGFGWVDGTPQSGETTVVKGDWGEGSEVGIMD